MSVHTVLITGAGGLSVGESVIQALRLSPRTYRIVGTDLTLRSAGLRQADAGYEVPPVGDPDYPRAILEICESEGVRALITGNEVELEWWSAERAQLQAAGVALIAGDRDAVELCLDKWKLARRLEELDIPTAGTLPLEESKDGLPAGWSFPVVVKAVRGSGSRQCHLVRDEDSLRRLAGYLGGEGGQFLVQRYLDGPEFTVGVVRYASGMIAGALAVERLHAGPSVLVRDPGGGVLSTGISQGRTRPFPHICFFAEQAVLKLGLTGPVNIQLRDTDLGPAVFEINARFSGTASIRAWTGFNEPDLLLSEALLGEETECRGPFRWGDAVRGLWNYFADEEADPGRDTVPALVARREL